MKKSYVKPTLTLFVFQAEDICTGSNQTCYVEKVTYNIDLDDPNYSPDCEIISATDNPSDLD